MEDQLRYPIGKFKAPEPYTSDYLSERIHECVLINSLKYRFQVL
jgi:hypothetical protein